MFNPVTRIETNEIKTFIFHMLLKIFTLFDKCCKHLDILRKYKWLWRMKLICINHTNSKFKLFRNINI